MIASAGTNLTSGRRLARNMLWNLSGQGIPLLTALVAIPLLISGVGLERFGILALSWALIGYASLFDFGLGRALTQLVACRLGQDRDNEIPVLVWTALALMAGFGAVGCLILLLVTPWLVTEALKIPSTLQDEAVGAFQVIACGIPVVTLATGLRGVLEAYQRFSVVALVNGLLGAATFLGPLSVMLITDRLDALVGAILLARALAAIAYGFLCLRGSMSLRVPRVDIQVVRPLFGFGAWMTVTNVVGPIVDYLDRFIVAGLLSIAVVAFYATPWDLVTRLWVIPAAISGVLFPAFATSLLTDRTRSARLFATGVRYVFLVLAPVVLIVVAFAYEGLDWWLGPRFSMESERVVQWLAVGVLMNSLARIPYVLIQAAGRPDLTAKLHLIEVIPYLLSVWWLVGSFGVTGAAIAWTLRVAVDAVLLFLIARRLLSGVGPGFSLLWRIGGVMMLAIVGVAFVSDPVIKSAICAAAMMLFVAASWHWLVEPDEIRRVRSYFRVSPDQAK